ncbi:MAG: pyridoxamine 5-phosphate oxidase [Paracoccaceae bacterium]|nr:pyridoxamine 5-phosphate oxidase [Paracoccaceae bacterium]
MSQKINPVQDPDEDARALACDLLVQARTAALGVIHPTTHAPYVSRVAILAAPGRAVFSLVSDLSLHCQALRADPRASLLLGDPGPRGDPLNQPRLSIQAVASFVDPATAADQDLRAQWLSRHPKSKLYIDFADFSFVDFTILGANLNGGFAKAYALGPNDFKINLRND